MNLKEAETLARNLMNEHGLDNWAFEFNDSLLTLGCTSMDGSKDGGPCIKLAKAGVRDNDEHVVKQTLLHEIAHALEIRNMTEAERGATFEHHDGHTPTWMSLAASIGVENPSPVCSLSKETMCEETLRLQQALDLLGVPKDLALHWDLCDCRRCRHNIQTMLKVVPKLGEVDESMASAVILSLLLKGALA